MITQRLLLTPALILAISCPALSTSAQTFAGQALMAKAAAPSPLAAATVAQTAPAAANATSTPGQSIGILPAASTEKLLPASILFKGQLAPVQARNSGALRHPNGSLTIVSLVDNSGYSSGVRERFQFFLYTEVPLELAPNKVLPAGFYGAGFLADNTMVVLDVASHDVMIVPTTADPSLSRPRPLQMLSASGETRLYLGRSYIILRAAH